MKFIPVIKIVLLCLLTTVLLYVNNHVFNIVLFVITVGLLLSIKKRIIIKKRIVPLVSTVVVLIIFHSLFNTAIPFSERLQAGLGAGIRLFTVSSLVFLYTVTASPSEIMMVFAFLPKLYQLLLTITLTTVPAIFEESEHITRVQKTRGLKVSRFNPLSHLLPVLLPLFHSIFARAEQLTIVMVTRGYTSGK